MTFSTTAQMLAKAIDESGLTQREIADRVGFKHANIITMMKQGLTRVPLDRIPALAQMLGLDQTTFLLVAIEEYHQGVYEVLGDTLGLPFSDVEQRPRNANTAPLAGFCRSTSWVRAERPAMPFLISVTSQAK